MVRRDTTTFQTQASTEDHDVAPVSCVNDSVDFIIFLWYLGRIPYAAP